MGTITNRQKGIVVAVALGAMSACGEDAPRYYACPFQPMGPNIPMVNLTCRRFGTFGTAGCLSDQQICQFKKRVTTSADVGHAIGMPQEMAAEPPDTSWSYICEQGSSGNPVHNDTVTFYFDPSGVLYDVAIARRGSGATPPPTCFDEPSMPMTTCGSVASPPLDTVTCRHGAEPSVVICTDPSGGWWTSNCSGGFCACVQPQPDNTVCSCTLAAGQQQCCPGVAAP